MSKPVLLTFSEKESLLEWIKRPNGSLSFKRVTFEAVETGGIWVRTKPYRAKDEF
jgi:hypothetical protein